MKVLVGRRLAFDFFAPVSPLVTPSVRRDRSGWLRLEDSIRFVRATGIDTWLRRTFSITVPACVVKAFMVCAGDLTSEETTRSASISVATSGDGVCSNVTFGLP